MIRLLASVRDCDEALAAAAAGADFIDLKEPRDGALGGLAIAQIREIVALLRDRYPLLPISATIGDHAADALAEIDAAVAAVAACEVDYVKVGIAGGGGQAQRTLLVRLAESPCPVVPVFIADHGLDFGVVDVACRLPFPAVMADTEDKRAGSLFDCVTGAELARFVGCVRGAGKLVGLSGALRAQHLSWLVALGPDFAGFRGALCDGARTSVLDPHKLRSLRGALYEATCAPAVELCAG
ncbi:MAG TPA: (5-formylfuran-3-yl)methyl phosphate synthase [Aromatoleum sp.]|uniref:(5-formylfuran-3-yl)methyl phosphate synthase n=1 Tax=Aromatoleum sp. TaxID=2307007 RepID=UPI002B4A40B2|nr:(5-formylfuran-3-yl)methyl phosphate synthase [Aromatoleum sp.]HJV25850.1 (5-formylfuran-3-yl)methyl phosphate synthase [Aromatoleum sp.]